MSTAPEPPSRGVFVAKGALFVLVVPGTVAGIGPQVTLAVTGRGEPAWWSVLLGVILLGAGGAALLTSVWRFAVEGLGTPAPVAPTEHLVVGGLYRYVRNPMYLAVTAVIGGQALIVGSWWLVAYAGAFLAIVASFVRLYEEPTLAKAHGDQYRRYVAAVPAWHPRLSPWRPES